MKLCWLFLISQLIDCLKWRVENEIDDVLTVSSFILQFLNLYLLSKAISWKLLNVGLLWLCWNHIYIDSNGNVNVSFPTGYLLFHCCIKWLSQFSMFCFFYQRPLPYWSVLQVWFTGFFLLAWCILVCLFALMCGSTREILIIFINRFKRSSYSISFHSANHSWYTYLQLYCSLASLLVNFLSVIGLLQIVMKFE